MLLRFDEDIAGEAFRRGCECGGVLNVANYHRAPRGMPPGVSADLRALASLRLSFCCATCRRRTTTPSLRFQGRSWYLAPVRLLASVMGKTTRAVVRTFSRDLGISRRTLSRWRRWWNLVFRGSPQWPAVLSYLRPGAHEGDLPDSILTSSATSDGRGPDIVAVLGILARYVDGTRVWGGAPVPLNLRRV